MSYHPLNLPRPIHPLVVAVGDLTPPHVRDEAERWNSALILPVRGCGNDHIRRTRKTPEEDDSLKGRVHRVDL